MSISYQCPKHVGTGLTPTDSACHAHESALQQRFHNLHCQLLGCPRALSGAERYPDVPLVDARALVERVLKKLG